MIKPVKKSHFRGDIIIKDSLWEIKFVKKVPGKKNMGLCDPSEKIIYVKDNLSALEMIDTLIHELIHACEFEYNLNIEHAIVYKLAEGLAQIYHDNFM